MADVESLFALVQQHLFSDPEATRPLLVRLRREHGDAVVADLATRAFFSVASARILCSVPLVRLLQSFGVSRTATDRFGVTVMGAAARQGHAAAVELLVECGFAVNVPCNRGRLALHYAAMNGHVQCLELLVAAGSQLNVQDSQQFTALHHAVLERRLSAVESLIRSGVTLDLVDGKNRTPEQLAVALGEREDIVQVFRAKRMRDDARMGPAFPQFLQLPMDIQEKISFHCSVEEQGRLAQTCKRLRKRLFPLVQKRRYQAAMQVFQTLKPLVNEIELVVAEDDDMQKALDLLSKTAMRKFLPISHAHASLEPFDDDGNKHSAFARLPGLRELVRQSLGTLADFALGDIQAPLDELFRLLFTSVTYQYVNPSLADQNDPMAGDLAFFFIAPGHCAALWFRCARAYG